MSGTDVSTDADRRRFSHRIEHSGICPASDATVLLNCQAHCPELTAGLLDLPSPATYAQAAARVLHRLTHGPR